MVTFDIEAGNVVDPVVAAACPPNIFDEAALKAVRQWKYSPSEPARQGVSVMLKFRPEPRSQ